MKTLTRHPTTTTAGAGRDAALRWLAQQLRWERLLADLRAPASGPLDQEEDEAA